MYLYTVLLSGYGMRTGKAVCRLFIKDVHLGNVLTNQQYPWPTSIIFPQRHSKVPKGGVEIVA